ncbi:MAG: general secretion pathway protein GspK [Cytophagaceae bacterium]|nr:general secretion pathway protein GspK [Gemmatimonadaceae bacterium]
MNAHAPMARRGIALVLVLWIVVILGGIGTVVVREAHTSAGLALNVRASAVARYAAESGIEATVAEIERTLGETTDSVQRTTWLNALAVTPRDSIALGEGRVMVSIVDPTARLDVNEAPEANIALLLSRLGPPPRAASTARAIRQWIERPAVSTDGRFAAPGAAAPRFVTPLRSLEELRSIPGVDIALLERAAPYLTIDGDGTVNVHAASDTVLAAAFGERRNEPSRLLLVARGWRAGHPLTHELQAVYALSGTRLVLVHWREQER